MKATIVLTVLLFFFVSAFCLAEQHPSKSGSKSTTTQQRPSPPVIPRSSPQGQFSLPRQHSPQVVPGQRQFNTTRINPSVTGPLSRPDSQVRIRPQLQEGATHPVERTKLQQAMHMPVYKEDQRMAVAQYHDERGHFTRNIEPVKLRPEYRAALTRAEIIPATYQYRRTVFYETYGWAPAPWVYGLYPRYGLYDTMFLAFMLDHIAEQQYALMYYNHMQEEEFMMWRQEMDNLAMENIDLKERLAVMDQQVASLRGTPRDSAYIPQDAQDVVLSPDVIDRLAPKETN